MKTRELTWMALCLALLVVCSQIALPIGPVPITLQSFAVLAMGYLLKPKQAALVTSLYLVVGLIGLPVFSNFQGGLHAIFLPSFGFIIGFIPAAYVQAKYLEHGKNYWLAGLLNISITYAVGLTYMAFLLHTYFGQTLTLHALLMIGLIPFIPGDCLKLAINVLLAKRLRKRVN